MKILVRSILLILIICIPVFSQSEEAVVKAKIISSVDKFKSGNSYPLAVEITIREPYHINAEIPSEDFLIPTSLNLEAPEGVTIGKLEYPKPLVKKFDFSEKALAVYEETVHIFTSISISDEFSEPEMVFTGQLGYQACDHHTCLAPDEIAVSGTFLMAAGGESPASINQKVFATIPGAISEAETEVTQTESGLAATIMERGWFLTFFLVFLGGLALNLTPCVYPLIPITISYFGGQSEGKKGGLLFHAFIYVFGMAITYSILGVIAALTGSLFGAALQNPVVLVGIAIILVGLALSMFDLYEIRIPAFLSNFAGGAKKGLFGTFFMGLTVGIVAAPCIGPFVLALLTFVGERGDVILGFWMFFVLALGLGVPFIFLALFSGSIHKIPRSGAWMIWVRNIFGFILIAMAVYFLQPLFPSVLSYFLTLTFTMLIGGIYMAWLEPTEAPGKTFGIIRNLVGIVFFIISIFFATNGIQAAIESSVSASASSSGNQADLSQINWIEYSEDQFQSAREQQKPIMLDFYADWCIPCKELDKFTFSQPEVIELSRNFTMMKVDLTRAGDPLTKTMKNRYNIKGVPTLVFLSPNLEEMEQLRVVGFMEKEEFLPIMEQALSSANNQ